MDFTLLIPTNHSFSSNPFTCYDFFNDPPKPSIEIASSSSQRVIDHEDDDPLLKLSLWSYGSSVSSSPSSSSSSAKKRKQTQNPSSSLCPPPPKKNKNTVLLDPKETMARLSLCPPDLFTIKKTLEESDVNDLARLMLAKEALEKHVLVHWDEGMKQRMRDKEGIAVKVWDSDRNVMHDMTMKIWGRNGSVILNSRWIMKFVRPRGLKKGDRIGLYWDRPDSRLVFSVLRQAPIAAVPISFRRPNDH